MQIFLIILAVCLALSFVWLVVHRNCSVKPAPPSTMTESLLKTQAIKDLSQLKDIRRLKSENELEYYKKLYFIVTSLSELKCLLSTESKFEGKGWFVKADRERIKDGEIVWDTVYFPSFGYGKGSGSEHYPIRYLKTEQEAEMVLYNILETRILELEKEYKKEIEKITLWED